MRRASIVVGKRKGYQMDVPTHSWIENVDLSSARSSNLMGTGSQSVLFLSMLMKRPRWKGGASL
jgi:hypothetical protein